MQHRGMASHAIEVALLTEDQACRKPPLTADEVQKIVCSIIRNDPASFDQTGVDKLILGSLPIDQVAFTAEQILKDMGSNDGTHLERTDAGAKMFRSEVDWWK